MVETTVPVNLPFDYVRDILAGEYAAHRAAIAGHSHDVWELLLAKPVDGLGSAAEQLSVLDGENMQLRAIARAMKEIFGIQPPPAADVRKTAANGSGQRKHLEPGAVHARFADVVAGIDEQLTARGEKAQQVLSRASEKQGSDVEKAQQDRNKVSSAPGENAPCGAERVVAAAKTQWAADQQLYLAQLVEYLPWLEQSVIRSGDVRRRIEASVKVQQRAADVNPETNAEENAAGRRHIPQLLKRSRRLSRHAEVAQTESDRLAGVRARLDMPSASSVDNPMADGVADQPELAAVFQELEEGMSRREEEIWCAFASAQSADAGAHEHDNEADDTEADTGAGTESDAEQPSGESATYDHRQERLDLLRDELRVIRSERDELKQLRKAVWPGPAWRRAGQSLGGKVSGGLLENVRAGSFGMTDGAQATLGLASVASIGTYQATGSIVPTLFAALVAGATSMASGEFSSLNLENGAGGERLGSNCSTISRSGRRKRSRRL